MLGPGRQFLSLTASIGHSQMYRDSLWEARERESQLNWQLTWLPISANVAPTVMECGGSFDAPMRCRTYDVMQPDSGMVGVGSLGALVAMYITAYNSGGWRLDRSSGTWAGDLEKLELPPEQGELI